MNKMPVMLLRKDIQKILEGHNLVRKAAAASPWDGLLLGNADMGAIVWGPASRLTFRLAKMDLWDARWNEKNYRHPLLLTSWDNIIRVFPGWPLEKKAEFYHLRAKGAFLVSASCAGGKIGAVRVQSERGNLLTIQSPFSKTRIFNQTTGRAVTQTRDGPLLRLNTSPGEIYRLEQGTGN